ncbi:MAG: YggS family pyridoxal phosphate-dependent enzyme [Firmicutes bacterium]|nr:YggS family pyridoxal phosphate-dependent enzyme [Bacillota bacterium]
MSIIDYGISDNVRLIQERICSAACRANRSPNDILLIGVTKTIDPERIMLAYDAGVLEFGENKAQELVEKYPKVQRECKWHFIGHLQTNKVKAVIDKVKLIHSLDRLELAEEIDKRARNLEIIMDALVEVNVAAENSKFGISPDQALEFIKALTRFPNLRIQGLMTIAPQVDNAEEVRPVFRELRQLLDHLKKETAGAPNLDFKYLSMGMSGDYEVAIEEGANMVRIGSAIFGYRQYPFKETIN